MNLPNIKKIKSEQGFTIVELLIVIVVIGILAAIIIVAYIGVTNNAKNSKYKSDSGSISKVAETINADTGSYPTTAAAFATGSATTKLPSGVAVTIIASSATIPTNAAAITAADGATATYTVKTCTSGGLRVYYPVRGGTDPLPYTTAGDDSNCT